MPSITRVLAAASICCIAFGTAANAQPPDKCPVTREQLLQALKASVKPTGGPGNGGLDNNEWAAVVSRTGAVCAIAFSGQKVTDQWLASRAIAVEKANTANAMSLDKFAISTANLYAQSIPGGSLYSDVSSNPPNAAALTAGPPSTYGTDQDPLIGRAAGGVIVFAGGLELYDSNSAVGGLGASGDTSCADHNIAWRIRKALKLDHVPNGVTNANNDAIIYDIGPDGKSKSGYGHPKCGYTEPQVAQQIGASASGASQHPKQSQNNPKKQP